MAEDFAAAGATLHAVPMRRISTSHGLLRRGPPYVLAWPAQRAAPLGGSRRVQADVVPEQLLAQLVRMGGGAAGGPAAHLACPRDRHPVPGGAGGRTLPGRRWSPGASSPPQRRSPLSLAPANVVIVHEEAGASDEFHPGRAGHARHRYGLADRSPAVGYVGRIDTWKGLDVLLDAVPALRSAGPA